MKKVMVELPGVVLWNEHGGAATVLSHRATCPSVLRTLTGVILLKQGKVPTWMESATASPLIKRVS